MAQSVSLRNLSVSFGRQQVLHNVSLTARAAEVTALIGPSGCGKTTLLRSINRMHDLYSGAKVSGQILLGEESVYAKQTDPVELRRRIGMIFQKPNPFPHLSIFENVALGIRLHGTTAKTALADQVEACLRRASLWDEVKDRLHTLGTSLSGGQQQRLCIARALAVNPQVFLMDEPCASLDPISTMHVEELLAELSREYTIIIVTHNMQQAARVSQQAAFVLNGELIEFGTTKELFLHPQDTRTEAYITGRMG